MPPPPLTQSQPYIQGPPSLPRILAPLDSPSYTHSQISSPNQPYNYGTLLRYAFVISVFLLAIPFLTYWMFVHYRKWRSHKGRFGIIGDHSRECTDEERLSEYRVGIMGDREEGERRGIGIHGGVGTTGHLVNTMKNMLWGSLRGITKPRTRGGTYATLPLPAVQFKRTEIKRGKTLQQENRGGWENSRSGYERNGGVYNGVGSQNVVLGNRRPLSGPYLYGLQSGWGKSTQSARQQFHKPPSTILGIHPLGQVSPTEYGSITTSSTVSPMLTIRKRSSGILPIEVESTQLHSTPQTAPRADYQIYSWDDILLGETRNHKIPGYSRKRVSGKPDQLSGPFKNGALSMGAVSKENNCQNPWDQSQGVLKQIRRSDRNRVYGEESEPQREHWWQRLMKEFRQGALSREENRLCGSDIRKPGGNQKVQTHQAQTKSVPPTGISRKFANLDDVGINTARPKYYMRGARNEGSLDGNREGNVGGAGFSGVGGDSSSESAENGQRIQGRFDGCRYDGGYDSIRDLVSTNLITPSQTQWNEESGQVEEIPEKPTINNIAKPHSDNSAPSLGICTPREQPVVASSSTHWTATSQSVSPPAGILFTHNIPPVLPSSSSIVFETIPLLPKPFQNSLRHCSPCPLPTPVDTLTIRNYISRPTRHLFLSKVFEPHIKEYGQFILPPLSKVFYEKWKKHNTTLYQQEPSIEEGWRLGIGDGRRERDRWLRLRSGGYEGQGVGKLLPRRCSDPGVRRCIGKLWMQAVGLATAVQVEGGDFKQAVQQRQNEITLGRAGLSGIYFPEWFSPGWGSEDEEVYRLLHDNVSNTEEASDTDVDIVLKHVARAKRREVTELLREFSEEMFLKEVDARLEWWWWQARGSAAGLAGREAERRRDVLLLQEGRKCSDSSSPPEMEKKYFHIRFPEELEEGDKWENWKLEMDVPGGVRDAGTFCFPKPPQGNGTLYRGGIGKTKGASILARGADWMGGVRCGHDYMGGLGRMVNGARRLMGKEGKVRRLREKEYEVGEMNSVCFGGDGSGDRGEEMVYGPALVPPTPLNDDLQFFCLGVAGSTRPEGENTTIHHEGAIGIPRHPMISLNSDSISTSSQSRSRGKGMTILLQQRRRRRRNRTSLANGGLGIQTPLAGKKAIDKLKFSVESVHSAESGYIACDEDTGILSSLSLLPGFKLGQQEDYLNPQSRVLSWGTDKSGDSVQSATSVESVSSGYGGEWGWSRLGVRKRQRSKRNRISKDDGEGVNDELTWGGMEPPVVQDEDDLYECNEEEEEEEEEEQTDLVPEDVRGSWGRNGGYLGLGVVKAVSEGRKLDYRRKGFAGLEVSAPGLGDESCRRMNNLGVLTAQTLPTRGQQQWPTSLSSECEPPLENGNQPLQSPLPWFMNLRSLRVPESTGSESSGMRMMGDDSCFAGATGVIRSGGPAPSSDTESNVDKEERKLDKMREVGKRVREVGTDRRRFKVGICPGVNAGSVDERRVFSEPVLEKGRGMERGQEREREREREFWTRRIGRNADLLFGPVNG